MSYYEEYEDLIKKLKLRIWYWRTAATVITIAWTIREFYWRFCCE